MNSLPTATELLAKSSEDLDRLFRSSPPGPVPDGDGLGTVLIATGGGLGRLLARAALAVAWQGKVFDAKSGLLRNKVTPLRIRAIRARAYPGPSWVDGDECIVLDYSRTSWVARWIRDEIRLVGPGLYLGVIFIRRHRAGGFSLSFGTGSADSGPERGFPPMAR
jgi:hypothetical protein